MKTPSRRFRLEHLESRLVPAFNSLFDGSTLTLTQTADDGAVTVTATATSVDVTDGAGAFSLGVVPANLTINLINGTNALSVALDSALSGNLSLNLASGTRTVDFTGAVNTIAGNLTVMAGTGNQTLDLGTAASLVVGGSANINLGASFDSVTVTNDLTVGSDLTFIGANSVDEDASTWTIGRNMSMLVNNESINSFYDPGSSGGSTILGGNFTYQGSSALDAVFFNGADVIGGSININLGNYLVDSGDITGPGFPQTVNLDAAIIGGNVSVTSGLNTLGDDIVDLDASTVIGGNMSLNLGGGINTVTLLGTFGGSSISYMGGIGVDSLTYGMTGSRARITAQMGAGADAVTILAGSPPAYLYVDFGAGVDTFTNGAGAFPFFLLNLP